ncbi:D-lactate dehydrogenase [Dactylonectria macrodidyma]|uniref:D-lactate dehydrogenase n=1 Tax=Dactylonectria macrodidyma TaxID=307937 RepID=A0A9P9IKV1_9HYPO|nr:D-lactate dehydrogenase [Dactylonectria macrodidyma]
MSEKGEILEGFLRQYPHIIYATPTSENYEALREAYILGNPTVPLAIVRPQTAKDVALLVSHAVAQGIEISVRSGGNDIFGRCFVQGALAIDMRDINFVRVADDCRSATIGGGIIASHLVSELGRYKLATAVGSAPMVGWIGWATHGGYGPFVANYGLGVDQIIAAKVADHTRNIVTADDRMLAAIRGGGGCMGVIVEVTIKVYPLDEVLGGVIVFKTDDLTATLNKFTDGYRILAAQGLPDALGLQQSIVNTPMGKVFAAIFMWSSSDFALGHHWLQQIENLGEVLSNSVIPTTIAKWLDDAGAYVPKTAYGGNCTLSIRNFTQEVITTVGEQISKMPDDPATLFSAHQLRGKSASPRIDSVFGSRTPHYVLEFIATSSSKDKAQEAWGWATGFREAMSNTTPSNILPGTYISLTPPNDANYPEIYGTSWERLVDIKKIYDPNNVFRHAMPQFLLSLSLTYP